MSKKTMDLASLEKRRARERDYYWAHRDEMRRKQRAYYQTIDKAVHAARIRKYRQTHREQCRAAQRAYRAKNRERIREMDRRYREKNRDKIRAAHRKYWDANRYRLCRNKLEYECFHSMEGIQAQCRERIEQYMEQWPYEQFADAKIKGLLRRWGIYSQDKLYTDCYDAGMLAYLYSIHRCALMGYLYVEQYIAKMIRILIICALNVGREAENLCQANGFQLCALDERRV